MYVHVYIMHVWFSLSLSLSFVSSSIQGTFLFAIVWSIGASTGTDGRNAFNLLLREIMNGPLLPKTKYARNVQCTCACIELSFCWGKCCDDIFFLNQVSVPHLWIMWCPSKALPRPFPWRWRGLWLSVCQRGPWEMVTLGWCSERCSSNSQGHTVQLYYSAHCRYSEVYISHGPACETWKALSVCGAYWYREVCLHSGKLLV